MKEIKTPKAYGIDICGFCANPCLEESYSTLPNIKQYYYGQVDIKHYDDGYDLDYTKVKTTEPVHLCSPWCHKEYREKYPAPGYIPHHF